MPLPTYIPRQKTLHPSLPGDMVKQLGEAARRKRVPLTHLCR